MCERDEWEHCDARCTCGDYNTVCRVVKDREGHRDEEYHCNSCGRDWSITWLDYNS